MTSRLPHCRGHPLAWVGNLRQELLGLHVLQQELLSLYYDKQTSALPRASTCLGGKSRSGTLGKYRFSNKNSSPSAMMSRHPQYCGHPHCRGHPPALVGSSRPSGACEPLLMGHPRHAWDRGGVGTRPWWLALLACGGAYWPLAFEPSAMTSRHPYYYGHPPSWVGI